MAIATIHQVVDLLQEGFDGLRVEIRPLELEELATITHRIMSVESRQYHSLDHIWTLGHLPEPTQAIAAVFHDLVHCQVDRQVPSDVWQVVSPYIEELEEEARAARPSAQDDRVFRITLDLFGFSAGQRLLASAGLSEFLSALFMNLKLRDIVAEQDLVRMAACIEATIPFRGDDSLLRLEERLRGVNQHYDLGMTLTEVEDVVKAAVVFGNQDVVGFSEDNVAGFLDDTWKLLPETNDALRMGHIFTIRQFRQALWDAERFLATVDPATVFHRFKGVPSEQQYQRLVATARRNVRLGQEYLQLKLLAMALLEALAEITGGDAPLCLFTGTIEDDSEEPLRLEDFLPPRERVSPHPLPEEVIRLLDSGRPRESSFDIRHSPLSLFLFRSWGSQRVHQLQEDVQSFFEGELRARDFLDKLDGPVVAVVTEACAAMVPTRREALLAYARSRLE